MRTLQQSSIHKEQFGILPNGCEICRFTLVNSAGCSLSIINYGAIVTSLYVPDREGILDNVVLGYDSLQEYLDDPFFYGAIVGRYGNRIKRGEFVIDGTVYQTDLNDGKNHLHGGRNGFHKKVWGAVQLFEGDAPSIKMSCISSDGEGGYPGNVMLSVRFTLTKQNELRIHYHGETDAPTILNPTHHSYFNLHGSGNGTILDHQLQILSDQITPVDDEMITTGDMMFAERTPFDFRKLTPVGKQIDHADEQLRYGKGYDHNWVLRNYDGSVRPAALLIEPLRGRVLSVLTDQPGLQFYSGNHLTGKLHGLRSGLCLEAQCHPDSPNKLHFPSVIVRPTETYHQTTIYQFSTQ